jgi:glycosyltransferase involved in cell wall biosynthesis
MPNIVVVNPRAMHFCESRATSIDLCVRDMVHYSRYKDATTVIGDAVDRPFAGIDFRPRPVARPDTFVLRSPKLLRLIRSLKPDAVCVQEHLRTASYLAPRLAVPVVLQKHNPIRGPKGPFDRLRTGMHFNRLAALVFVSEAQRSDFDQAWPGVRAPRQVVTNSLDTTLWAPAAVRGKTILVVGRATPEKGIKQAAEALADVLPRHPDWRARFILNEVEASPGYLAEVEAVLGRLGPQAALSAQRPLAEVKEAMESAAITVVPSIVKEAFGRVALEAHAAGSAVISSGAGGLRQVSGDAALYLSAVEPGPIAGALERLISHDALRADLAARGRERAVALFDVRNVVARSDDFYETLLRSPRDAGT